MVLWSTYFSTRQPDGRSESRKNRLITRAGPGQTEAGPSVTTRRAVAPKPGLVGPVPEGFGKKANAER